MFIESHCNAFIVEFFLPFRARMIPGSVDLGAEGVIYIDEIQNSIAVGEVQHALSVNLDVR